MFFMNQGRRLQTAVQFFGGRAVDVPTRVAARTPRKQFWLTPRIALIDRLEDLSHITHGQMAGKKDPEGEEDGTRVL